MNNNQLLLKNWHLYFENDEIVNEEEYKTIKELENSNFKNINVVIPCNFENELMKNGIIKDIYFGDNIFDVQKYDYHHQWYATRFDCDVINPKIVFKSIDTISTIYLNGELLGKTDNMFLEYSFDLKNIKKTNNEIVVHIFPVLKESQNNEGIGMGNYAFDYNYSSLSVRKSPFSFGWDIFPRVLGGGLTKDVIIESKKESYIKESYLYTRRIYENVAELGFYYSFYKKYDAENCEIEINAQCKDRSFSITKKAWHTEGSIYFDINNPYLWSPIYEGEPNLYEVTFNLLYKNEILDSKKFKFGIRTINLVRTKQAFPDGKFEFVVNNKKIFILGTNWVPLDVLYTKSNTRMEKALSFIKDLGCNMVRVWGGGYYEDEEFYNWCDENGVLVWQDFMMSCAVYPQDLSFQSVIQEEGEFIVKKLRQHPSIALWCGDNECDCAYNWTCVPRNPNLNYLTRNILPKVIEKNDYVRPFLPSSPYMEDDGYLTWNLSEWHEWAQKEFFRSDHFKEMKNQFISETGYFSFPSINSLKYFLKEPYNFYDSKSDEYSDEFKAHIVSMEKDTKAKYYFRTSFVKKHILDLFGYYPDKLDDVVKMSQISQAEALKYFIERMRIKRDKNGGIIIWNLLDGYTQISDSLIDYYFRKKLSYYYVKRSQQPLCFIMDSSNSLVSLYCVNDYSLDFKVSYKATDLKTKNILTKGELTIGGHSNLKVAEIDSSNMEPTFYLIEWSINNEFVGKNHYCPVLPGIKYEDYLKYMCDSQFENFE